MQAVLQRLRIGVLGGSAVVHSQDVGLGVLYHAEEHLSVGGCVAATKSTTMQVQDIEAFCSTNWFLF